MILHLNEYMHDDFHFTSRIESDPTLDIFLYTTTHLLLTEFVNNI